MARSFKYLPQLACSDTKLCREGDLLIPDQRTEGMLKDRPKNKHELAAFPPVLLTKSPYNNAHYNYRCCRYTSLHTAL